MSSGQPNFILILTDTQGANVIGAYGHPEMRTPNLDRLAAEGVRFDQAYTTCPICTPARAGLFTGQYPHNSGPWANELPLTLTAKTMGQRFRDAGYRTAYSGKWHLSGQDYFDTGVCPDGWDDNYWFDGRRYLSELSDYQIQLWRQELSSTEALKKQDIPAEFTWAHGVSNRGIEFLETVNSTPDQPFLLVLSYDEPHGPCACPKEYVERFENFRWSAGSNKNDDLLNKPAMQREIRESSRSGLTGEGDLFYPPYFACNSYVDAEIGRVLKSIDELAPGNTYVFFTSDHGDFMGAHGLLGKGYCMYGEASRIPLIVRQPRNSFAGSINSSPVSHIDILPTMLELAGLEVPPILDGVSIAPHLEGKEEPEREIVIEWNRADADVHASAGLYPVRCLIRGQWKLVINLLDSDELYDLQSDSCELQNRIYDTNAATIRNDLHDRLMTWMDEKRDPFRGPAWRRRPWHTSGKAEWFEAGGKPRPADGYMPPVLDYWTGKPAV
jgi:uncharacterized sulfatase